MFLRFAESWMRKFVLAGIAALLVGWGAGLLVRALRKSEAPAPPPPAGEAGSVAVTFDVRLPNGEPADDASIYFGKNPEDSRLRKRIQWTAARNRAHVLPGIYWMWAVRRGAQPLASPRARVVVEEGTPIVLRMEPRPGLRGTVVTPEPLRSRGARVWAARFTGASAPSPDTIASREGVVRGTLDDALTRYEFEDLEPGRYRVALLLSGRDVGAHGDVDVAVGMAELTLTVPPFSREDYLLVRVRDSAGQPVPAARLYQSWHHGPVSVTRQVPAVERADGSWYVPKDLGPDVDPSEGEFLLTLRAEGFGTLRKTYAIGERADLVLRFREPAQLHLRVVEDPGGLRRKLAVVPVRVLDDGRIDFDDKETPLRASGPVALPPLQPGSQQLALQVSDQLGRAFLSILQVDVKSGESQHEIRIPEVHELRLEGADPGIATLLRIDQVPAWSHQVANVPKDRPLVFSFVPAGRYALEARHRGEKRRVEIEVPAERVVRWE